MNRSISLFLHAAQILRDAGFSPSVTEVRVVLGVA